MGSSDRLQAPAIIVSLNQTNDAFAQSKPEFELDDDDTSISGADVSKAQAATSGFVFPFVLQC